MNTALELVQKSEVELIASAVVSLEEYFDNTGEKNPSLLMSLKTVQSYVMGEKLFTDKEAREHKNAALRLAGCELRFCIQAVDNNLSGYHECDIDCVQDVVDGLNAVDI